ncbi:acetate/propionate family kinase [bacterium]|nr:acetate/propionate family kinase [bacterium]
MKPTILTINGGSSSIKFAFYHNGDPLWRCSFGKVSQNASGVPTLTITDEEEVSVPLPMGDGRSAVEVFVHGLEQQDDFQSVKAVGHRVVHGMERSEPELVTPDLIEELQRISPFAPEHLPAELDLIEAFHKRHPQLVQVACFDTAFHLEMPRVAKQLPIPRRFEAKGIRRYGFHGLSYAYLMEELVRLGDPAAEKGRLILCHLGNGSSMAAVRDGKSVDTSMGFSPTSGLMMSTRTGDLDPGVAAYLAATESMTAAEFYQMANHESGLLGVSETSSDICDLLKLEANDERAAEAVELFCYQAKKLIGSLAAVLGGVDTIVFSGGIGEHSPQIRSRICHDLEFLGIEFDQSSNSKSSSTISTVDSRVTVRVIATDEEQVIARSACRVLDLTASA